MVKDTDRMDQPGRELPKEYREVAVELVSNQGWRYDRSHGRHPVLYPADRTKAPLTVATTPGDRKGGRGFKNWLRDVRRRGGVWPPERKG